MQLSTKQIMEIIPHRQPFLLLDTIEELEPGVRAVGKKCVTYNEPFFAGHFPQEPVMPGVLILEALAQAGFKGKVVPGDVLLLETQIIKVKGPIGIGSAKATVNGKLAAKAELTFVVSEPEKA